MFRQTYDREESQQPAVSHYTVNNEPISTIAMPVIINREAAAIVTIVAHSSNLIPRYKKLLNGLSVALSVSINYIRNIRKRYTPNGSVKYADNTIPYEDALVFIESVSEPLYQAVIAVDSFGNIALWSSGMERLTGIRADEVRTISDIRHILAPEGDSGLFTALQSGVPFEELAAPVVLKDEKIRSFLWTLRKVGTSRGALSLLTGLEMTSEPDSGKTDDLTAQMQLQWLKQALTDIDSLYIVVLDSSLEIEYMNPQLAAKLAAEEFKGMSFVDAFVPKHEHVYVESALNNYLSAQGSRQPHEQFHLVSGSGQTLSVDWHLGVMPGQGETPATLWLFGSEVPDELFQVTRDKELKHFPYRSAEAKLSKHYRFLMKYVPFPIIHLDETSDVIRNANLAFEEIIGTRNWESTPVSDFGSLEIHPGVGDASPCTLYVLNPEGITMTYRGIMTPLQVFGKNVREIKLDPLE
jgi:PAS domain-containing protein